MVPSASNGEQESKKTVVFIDLENIYIGFRKQYGRDLTARELVEKARSFGGVKMINIYGDFSEPTYPQWFKLELDNQGVLATNVPKDRDRDGHPTKNRIDIRIVVDIFRALAFRPELEHYVLMTGDKIFLDVLNLIRNDFGKEVLVSGIEGTVAQVLQQAAEFVPFNADSSFDESIGHFVQLMDRLEHRVLEGTYSYLGWKLVIDQLKESSEFGFSEWRQARDFFERIKREGKLILRSYPGQSREIEAYRLDRRNPLVRRILQLDANANAN
ncbi:MAG TPA: NYN domain-containing protein [Candidatus Fraserbacteria bacterium]|nr:NYN domain-containing protein [Candidatus Fraserbacteria bacterium]